MSAKDPFTRDIKVGEDWTIPNSNGIGRRTIVEGAVWTVPVVAFATNASAAAASATPTLEFTQPSYSGVACGTISNVVVQLTTDGTTPAGAGQQIDVTLPSGWTFADGSTVYSWPTDGTGSITLPDITVPIGGGDGTILASSGSLTNTAGVSAPTVTVAKTTSFSNGVATNDTADQVPSGSTVVGWGSFLAPNGDLYHANDLWASNVTSADVQHIDSPAPADFLTYVENGVAKTTSFSNGVATNDTADQVPSGSTVVGWGSFLAPNGDLYHANDLWASNVTSADVQHIDSPAPADFLTYVENGVAKTTSFSNGVATNDTADQVPSGSTVVGWGSFLAPNGDLYHANDLWASNVTSADVQHIDSPAPADFLTYVENGVAKTTSFSNGVATNDTADQVPSGSTVVGWGSFLAPNGDLYHANDLWASNVTSADVQHEDAPSPADFLTYVEKACA
ncbi:hypothetical protein Q0F99_08110 [Rathayibacter oskolensis]|uniref:hypothetical protein n=1 Tax=Rathayibacter oskolensis TaxID=1891671 RepID=UPI00265D8674|nr:hypothetical protein [Rathayibacter oskolensis]WKK72834.1 hypothetical protein Q0F99_08110 [Rathayibacter oskolensis]